MAEDGTKLCGKWPPSTDSQKETESLGFRISRKRILPISGVSSGVDLSPVKHLMKPQPQSTSTAALLDSKQRTQLSCGRTPDPQKV